MSTVSGTSTPLPVPPSADADRRAPLTRRFADALGNVVSGLRSSEEHVWRWAGRIAVIVPLVALTFCVTVLAIKAWPAMKLEGVHFLTSSEWNPGGGYAQPVTTDGVTHPQGATYGAWPLILGTLQSSVIALVIAVPISIGGRLGADPAAPPVDLPIPRVHPGAPRRHPERDHRALGRLHPRADPGEQRLPAHRQRHARPAVLQLVRGHRRATARASSPPASSWP